MSDYSKLPRRIPHPNDVDAIEASIDQKITKARGERRQSLRNGVAFGVVTGALALGAYAASSHHHETTERVLDYAKFAGLGVTVLLLAQSETMHGQIKGLEQAQDSISEQVPLFKAVDPDSFRMPSGSPHD